MTNFNLYRVFYYVAQELNLTRASEKLFISQPAVSSSIKELEREHNQILLYRKNKGIELTTYGKLLYKQISPLIINLESLENLSTKYNNLEKGILRIGSSSSNVNQILMEYLKNFITKFKNIKVIMQRNSKENLIKSLNNNDLDIIFIDYNNDNFDNFALIKKYDIKYQLIGNKIYKEKFYSENINIKEFPLNELIIPSKNNKSREFIENYFTKNGIKIEPKYELDNYILLYDFVKNGFGIAFVNATYYKEKINNHEVEIIFPNFFLPARSIACFTSIYNDNSALNEFLKFIN